MTEELTTPTFKQDHECPYDSEDCDYLDKEVKNHNSLCPTCQSDLEYAYNIKVMGFDKATQEPDRNYSDDGNPLSVEEIETFLEKVL